MASKVLIPMADGFEEVEAVTIVDLLRRGGIDVVTASVGASKMVTGAHGVPVGADKMIADVKDESFTAVILPGGMPGTTNLAESDVLGGILKSHEQNGAVVAAICAAPTVLAKHGILQGKNATCYPGFEDKVTGATMKDQAVVEDGKIVTSKGPGTAIEFSLKMIEKLEGPQKSQEVRQGILA